MCDFLQGNWTWPTFWAFVQAIGVPISIGVAIWLPWKHQKGRELADVVAFRNIAEFSARMVVAIAERGSPQKYEIETLTSCHRLLMQVQLDRVHPAEMSEAIARVDVGTGRFLLMLKDCAPKHDLEISAKEVAIAMQILNKYLDLKGCSLQQGSMYRAP